MARRQRLLHQSRTQARDALGCFSRNPASTVPCCLTSSSSPASHAAIGPRRPTPSSMSKYLAATSAPLSTQGQIHDKTPKSPKKKGRFKGSGPTASVTKMELEGCCQFSKMEVVFSYSEDSDDEDEEVLKSTEIRELAEKLRRALRGKLKKCLKLEAGV